MASFPLTRVDRFPDGTSVGAYPASGWSQASLPPSGAPPVSATATATMTSGTASFTGLADGTAYFFGASVSGTWRYVRGRTDDADTGIVVMTQAAYDALSSPDSRTLYVIVG